MKKTFTVSLMMMLSASQMFASSKAYDASGMLDMYYKKGLEQGAKNGYEKGFSDALELAKKRVRLYGEKVKANESGKYLKEYGGKITNPEIYQMRDGNSINVIVKGCKIEKQLTPDEIIDLELYPIDGDDMKFKYYNLTKDNTSLFDEQNPYGGSGGVTNSADVFDNDKNGYFKDRPSLSNSNKKALYLPNSNNLRSKLAELNYTYTIENNQIKFIYGSEREKDLLLQQLNEPVY